MPQYFGKNSSHLAAHHGLSVLRGDLGGEAGRPFGVLLGERIGSQILTGHEMLLHRGQLLLETGWQYRQAHHLNEADVLLLNVM